MKSAEMGGEPGFAPEVANITTAASSVLNVWLVDNQPIFQKAVASVLQATEDLVLGAYFVHPEDALPCDQSVKHPDIILIDISQFVIEGIPTVKRFGKAFPAAPVIIFTNSLEEEIIVDSICAGAAGYLLKNSLQTLPQSIRDVVSGGALLAPAVARHVLELFKRFCQIRQDGGLTLREVKILELMGQGLVLKEIAQQLTISYHTADSHARNIYIKLGVHSRAEAVAKALRARII